MSQKNVERLLNEFALTEIYFGSEGFRICKIPELPEAQLGYAKHPNGNDLTGENEGDWKKEWIVIGNDTSLGDPYFIDTSVEALPVYTAMHGMGSWNPEEISPSLRNFLGSLKHLQSISRQDCARIDPDKRTLMDRKKIKELEAKLNELNGERYFWGGFFERYIEWLEENDS